MATGSSTTLQTAAVRARRDDGQAVSMGTRVTDVLCSVVLATLCAASVAMLTGSPDDMKAIVDFSGVLFLLVSLFFRGSFKSWWLILAPVGLVLLFTPIAHWESLHQFESLGELARAALVPGLSFVGASLVMTIRQTTAASLEGALELRHLGRRSFSQVLQLRKLEVDMREIMRGKSVAMELPRSPIVVPKAEGWEKIEFTIDEEDLEPAAESLTMTYTDIQKILSVEMDRWALLVESQKTPIKLSFSAPAEMPIPLAVRGSARDLEKIVRALMIAALEALGGQEGTLRLTLRPEMKSVSITIEDNGRGLSEPMLERLESKGILQTTTVTRELRQRMETRSIRQLAEKSGWELERLARLGVGSRVKLELPRVDAHRYGARTERNREFLRAGTVIDASVMKVNGAADLNGPGWTAAPTTESTDHLVDSSVGKLTMDLFD